MKFGVRLARTAVRDTHPCPSILWPLRSQTAPPKHRACLPVALRSQKVIQAAASENPEWASYYVDYKALKQILGQLTPLGEEQTEGGAQLEGLFLSSLLLQLHPRGVRRGRVGVR